VTWKPEDTVHVSILSWLQAMLPHAIIAHVPNGGGRTEGEARKMKRLGVLPGFPDLIVMPGGGQTLLLEVKAEKGRVSPEQRAFGMRVTALGGYVWAVVRSIDDVKIVLRSAGIQTREAGVEIPTRLVRDEA